MTRLVTALALALALPGTAVAQRTLEDVEALIQVGRYEEARAAIDAWWERPGNPDAAAVVRGHMLRARLTLDPAEAEADYLAIVLGHPANPAAAEALLRLGQALLLRGEVHRAQGYLQRLVADYPGSPRHGPGTLWLARSYNASDRHQAACRIARRGIAETSDPNLAALLRLEEAASCRLTAEAPEAAPETPEPAPDTPEPTEEAEPAGNFAVQAGAFRQQEGAEALAERLRQAGHRPRLVRVPNSQLLRVRLGRFASAQDAGRLVRTLEAEGFSAIVVADAHRERRP